jgi:hypothetical protein
MVAMVVIITLSLLLRTLVVVAVELLVIHMRVHYQLNC